MAKTNQQIIKEALLSTKRDGMEDLIDYMEQIGFFTAPCSGAYHLCKEGGLVEHTVNVITYAEKLANTLLGKKNISEEFHNAIIISAALHDLGKAGQFGKPNYVPNMIKSKKKNPETGDYDLVQSTAKPFETNKELLPVDHEIRSITMASMFIDLTEDEQYAILYHNGLYGNLKYVISGHETPLYMIVHWADMWASYVIEI